MKQININSKTIEELDMEYEKKFDELVEISLERSKLERAEKRKQELLEWQELHNDNIF